VNLPKYRTIHVPPHLEGIDKLEIKRGRVSEARNSNTEYSSDYDYDYSTNLIVTHSNHRTYEYTIKHTLRQTHYESFMDNDDNNFDPNKSYKTVKSEIAKKTDDAPDIPLSFVHDAYEYFNKLNGSQWMPHLDMKGNVQSIRNSELDFTEFKGPRLSTLADSFTPGNDIFSKFCWCKLEDNMLMMDALRHSVVSSDPRVQKVQKFYFGDDDGVLAKLAKKSGIAHWQLERATKAVNCPQLGG